ncbi:MAG TPA: hypothetical protein VFS08_10065 [Gemmatimonadaceae bacterium]|nr:hypothetical protein [Gemmatimonadaceae bacterium]
MPDYAVFGGWLRSSLRLPELRPHPGGDDAAPDWTLTVASPEPLDGARRLGAQHYAGDVEVALLAAGDSWRVATSDIGDFDITNGGRHLTWRPTAGAREDLARFDLLGRVLPLALHRLGALPLHGSSVVLPHGPAVAFLAPKGHGKSTLAVALAQAGGRLLSDDVTVLDGMAADGAVPGDTGSRVRARPGVQAVRLWADSARWLRTDAYGAPDTIGRKLVLPHLPESLLARAAAPVHGVYLLTATAPDAGAVAERRSLGEREATVALVRQVTAGGLLGGSEGALVLARAAAVARAVPVYALSVARDFDRLGAVVQAVLAWHAPRPAAAHA